MSKASSTPCGYRCAMNGDTTDKPTGRGGPLGTPTQTANTQPPSADQDANSAVSGGGIVDEDGAREGKETARRVRPTSD